MGGLEKNPTMKSHCLKRGKNSLSLKKSGKDLTVVSFVSSAAVVTAVDKLKIVL